MRLVVVYLSSFVILVAGDQHLHANGPFGKRHTTINEPSPYACNRPDGIVPSLTTVAVSNLNLSATVYSSNEQIKITWTPLSSSCQDDFIGVYFAETPLAQGKYPLHHDLLI